MKKGSVYKVKINKGVTIDVYVLDIISNQRDYTGTRISYLIYAQNRIAHIEEVFVNHKKITSAPTTIVEYCVIPEADDAIKAFNQITIIIDRDDDDDRYKLVAHSFEEALELRDKGNHEFISRYYPCVGRIFDRKSNSYKYYNLKTRKEVNSDGSEKDQV